jgi:cephalosporin hydroxylase
MGVPIQKLPLDLWRYHDILWRTRPDVIVETGTNRGGSALFLAHLCDHIGSGRIITVDIVERPEVPKHPRIAYIVGSSTDTQTFARVTGQLGPDERIMVVLDSDHSRDHVVRELELYSPLVSSDCYLIVEDTDVNGHPVSRSHGPGPMEALGVFPWKKAGFEYDDEIVRRYVMTFFPKGWLRRVSVSLIAEDENYNQYPRS